MKSLKERVENFWKVFSDKEEEIRELMETNKLVENFNKVESLFEVDMPFMLGKNKEGKYELIFNPSGLKSRYFISDYFKRKMPVELKKKWVFYDMKPAMGMDNIHFSINGKTFLEEDFSILIDNINTDNKRVNITFICKKFFDEDNCEEREQYNIIYNIMDALLGEAFVESYLGMINIKKEENTGKVYTLNEFEEEMSNVIVQNNWEKNPKILDRYDSYKSNLENITDNSALREDIIIGLSSNFGIIRGYREEGTEYNFMSNQGCIYGMIFYNNTKISDEKKLFVRDILEKKLTDLPEYGDIFEIFGFATGMYNSYIDVIIYDIEAFYIILEKIDFGPEFENLSYKDFMFSAPIRKIMNEGIITS